MAIVLDELGRPVLDEMGRPIDDGRPPASSQPQAGETVLSGTLTVNGQALTVLGEPLTFNGQGWSTV